METGLLSKALDDIAAALAIDPSSAAAWAAKGDAHLRLHSTEDEISMKYYDRAIALNQHCEAAWRSRARLFAKEQSYRQAIRDYSRLIEISGKHADVFERGLALQASNQHDAAIRDFNLAIERKADVPAYYGRRSISWSKIGQFDNAIADVGTAINLDKDNPSGFSHRAVYRVRQGDLRLAITDWLVSIELTENHAGFNYQPLRENPPAQEMLQHGEGQLLAMLRDRPEMATFVKQGDRLWIWAVRKLAGEDVGEPVYWNPETLKYHPARHSYPAPQSVGWIQISSDSAVRADGDGTAFEHLWACLAFELHNMTFAKDFADVVERVSAGELTPQGYVLAVATIERRAKELQSAFYAHVFLPWALEANFRQSHPEYWQVSLPDPEQDPERLLHDGANYVTGYSDNHTVMVARLDCEAGKFDKAAESLQALIAKGPILEDDELSQAYFWLGSSLLSKGNAAASLEALKNAVAHNDQWAGEYFAPMSGRAMFGKPMLDETSQTAAAHYCRGMVSFGEGKLQDAEVDLDKAIVLEPNYAAALIQRGQVHWVRGEYVDCLADADKALQAEPEHVAALLMRGQAHAALAQPEKAQMDYSEYIRRLPSRATGWLARACVLRQVGAFDSALSDFSEAIRLAPEASDNFLERARLHFLRGNLERTRSDLDQALSIQPDNGAALELRALVWARSKDAAKAIHDADEAVRLRPGIAASRVTRGQVYALLGKQAKALGELQAAVELNPDHVDARIVRSQLFLAMGDYDACIADLNRVVEVHPARNDAYLLRGRAWAMKDDPAKAIADLDAFVQVCSGSAESLCARGELLLSLDDEKGLADLDSALKNNPTFAPAYLARAKYRHFRGDFDGASHDFADALQLSPTSSEARMGRAEVEWDLGQYNKALLDVEEAVRVSPGVSLLHSFRGRVFVELHQLDKALADAEVALALDADNYWGYLIRGDVAWNREDFFTALTEYDRAVELHGDEPYPYAHRAKFLSECPNQETRDTTQALRDATQACELTGFKVHAFLSSLAACYAEAGDFKNAVEWQTKAVDLAVGDWKTRHATALKLFQSQKTLRQADLIRIGVQSTQ